MPNRGVIAKRHDYDRCSVALSTAVPFRVTREHDYALPRIWRGVTPVAGPDANGPTSEKMRPARCPSS